MFHHDGIKINANDNIANRKGLGLVTLGVSMLLGMGVSSRRTSRKSFVGTAVLA